MGDNLKNRAVTKAPEVPFEDVHIARQRELKVGPNLPPSGGSDGIESTWRRCKQCGFVLNTAKTNQGNPYGNISQTTVRPSSTNTAAGTLGGTTTYAGGSETTTADYIYSRIINCTGAGVVNWVVVYVANATAANITIALFNYENVLLSYTEERTILTAGWYAFRVLKPVDVAVGTVIHVGLCSGSAYSLYYSAAGVGETVAQDYDYFPPARVPVWTATAYDYSIYLSYTKGDSFQSDSGAGCPLCGSSEY